MPTISVVVPCYNGGKFLDQLTACLAQQTFRDFEIIVVDDGSTDSFTKAKLTKLDPAIRVVHQENRGASAARNTGFFEARADLVMVLDCDDQLEPSYLEECLGALSSAPPEIAFVLTHTRLVGARQGLIKNSVNPFDALSKNVTGYAMLIRKACWRRVGGYDESMSMRDGYEDWEFCLRLISAGYRGIAIPKPLFIYRVSEQGMHMGHASRLHATLWQRIRKKHRDLYRVSNLVRLFLETRTMHSEVSRLQTVAALLLTNVLPDSWFSAIVHLVRSHRLSRSKISKDRPHREPTSAQLGHQPDDDALRVPPLLRHDMIRRSSQR